ncbi:MAG: STAS domain-containing protein [Micromonosporaceae bacterium]
MDPTCKISQVVTGDRSRRLVIAGDVDLAAHDELCRTILAAIDSGVGHLVVDLRQVTFFDSGAVGVLVAGHNAARRAGCTYQVVDPPDLVRRVLRANGILQLLVAGQDPAKAAGRPA